MSTHLADTLRRLRHERGLTQPELAELASVQPSYVSHLERGRRSPSLSVARRLAAALSVSVGELVDEPEAA
jgi:transcriptional regulator with XRE-family HTH domain